MGSAVALRLAQRGVGVTVVERGIPGAEASSAAAGILGPQMEADGPGPLLELGPARAARCIRRWRRSCATRPASTSATTGRACSRWRSTTRASRSWRQRRAWQQRAQPERRLAVGRRGARARAGARARRSAPRCAFPDDAQVNARELARAFSQAAASAGARFLTGRYVRRVVIEGGAATGVELDGETLPAGTRRRGGRQLVRPGRGRRRARDRRAPGARPARVDRDAPAAVPPRGLRARRLPGPAPRRHRARRQHRRDGRLPQAGHRRRPGRDPDAWRARWCRRWPTRR